MLDLLVGLDLESTGNDPTKDRIIEIAAVALNLSTGNTVFSIERRYNPECAISAKAAAIHGITTADVIKCPTLATQAPTLRKIFERAAVVVAHNGDEFDFVMIKAEFERIGLPLPEFQTFDTMKSGRWATPDGKYPTLGELCWSLGVPYDKALAHGALYDVDVMLQAFSKAKDAGIWEVKLPTDTSALLVSA